MAYTPTEWQTGDVVTAEKLNKLENGIMSGAVYIPVTYDVENNTYSIPTSYNDVIGMIENGQCVFSIIDRNDASEEVVAKELFLIGTWASVPASNMYGIVFMSMSRLGIELEFMATDPDAPMTTEEVCWLFFFFFLEDFSPVLCEVAWINCPPLGWPSIRMFINSCNTFIFHLLMCDTSH